MCHICLRDNCCPMFHSEEEQTVFWPALEAYERFVQVREGCANEYMNTLQENDNE